MAETCKSSSYHERISKEAPQLVAVLKEMKDGLDVVTNKIQSLTAKVKADDFPTSDGMSYLEAKHLLLLNYCQSIVYYLLSKAKGLSIQGHPVVRSLVEIRVFLEKIRPIDKKLQYQIQKLTRASTTTKELHGLIVEEADESQKTQDLSKLRPDQDLLKLRPNPDLLVTKQHGLLEQDDDGVYRPPRFAPATMEEDKISKQEKNALRKEKEYLRQANQSDYLKELMNNLQGKPEEVKETIGAENREMKRYSAQMEKRAQQEEELFNRVSLNKAEKKKIKYLQKSSNGLLGLTEGFFEDVKALAVEDTETEKLPVFNGARSGEKKFKKRKRKH